MKLALAVVAVAAATAPARADAPGASPIDPAPASPFATPSPRWLSVGAMTELTDYQPARGVRGDADLYARDGWILGAGAALAAGKIGIYDGSRTALLSFTDVKLVGYVARGMQFRHWELRAALGFGVVRTSAHGDMTNLGTMTPVEQTGLFPTAEAAIRATVPISSRIAIVAGPILTYYHQTFEFQNPGSNGPTTREGELMLMAGVAYRP